MKRSFIEMRDIFIIIGLSSVGAGLYFWFGLGQALTVVGAVILLLSVFGSSD